MYVTNSVLIILYNNTYFNTDYLIVTVSLQIIIYYNKIQNEKST